MASSIQKFNAWVRQHKLFALATPVVLLLLIQFVTTSLKGMETSLDDSQIKSGYNNNLPNQANKLEVKDPNAYYKETVKDSFDRLQTSGSIKNIVTDGTEKDSLARILEDLDNFSIEENEINKYSNTTPSPNKTIPANNYDKSKEGLTPSEKRLKYREMLQKARQDRQARSQDYSAPSYVDTNNKGINSNIKVSASIYRDQFILPGNRVTLILREELKYKDIVFPKNTFVYAIANIQQSRILLEVHNIDDVQVRLKIRDVEDNRLGIYNETAGELLMEFYDNVQEETLSDVSNEFSNNVDIPMTNNAIRAFGNFFSSKKRKNRDEIPLINGHKVYLVNK